ITGSIAAYKIPLLIRLLIKENADVQVIMTPCAKSFVTPLTLSTLSKKPVMSEPFDPETGSWVNHVELGRWADLMLIAPASANTIGKMAHGIADNFLTTAYLSAKCPVLVAPAMDLDMYQHPSTQSNIAILRSFGNTIIEPQVGELASGLCGAGRMEEPEKILEEISACLSGKEDMKGKKILITAGPTRENIDPVRFISNHSSGLMGFALAEECAERGAMVTLITGPTNLTISHQRVNRIDVTSADEMHKACMKETPNHQMIIMAAAVADYSPLKYSSSKIKKTGKSLRLDLTRTPDILSDIASKRKKNQVIVGFALESDNEIASARKKLLEKKIDFIVFNSLKDAEAGFNKSTNKVSVLNKKGRTWHFGPKAKREIAADIINTILL
ncbi:MAG: bifunctional phosphopantothenoylcysteine decarboxylase/phosphopantothenate--cysteine ligase CoaBC, partial [Bacteroidetes bacterium]|nr:bifunctional phosphopantothenoylcysteine decarboxylase/phosphopantothenate--cysteine ligase CoaBC [Bacteroidota bacterium]